MESNKNLSQDNRTTGSTTGYSTPSTASPSSTSGQPFNQTASAAATRARDEATAMKEKAAEVVDQTKQVVSNAYDKTAQTLTNTYDHAVSYGRENPGTATLIAFGAGVGIGLLLASSLSGRSRMNRIAEPIVGALSQVALEFLR
jgi:ElaB/YqjD/DUF883 family membrane-anchored ribosome-binding protein